MKKASAISIMLLLAISLSFLITSCRRTETEESPRPTSEPLATSPAKETVVLVTPEPEQTPALDEEGAEAETTAEAVGEATRTPQTSVLSAVIVSGDFAGEGKPFTFDATQSQAGAQPIVAYEWDMGDDSHLFGLIVEHVYFEPDFYTVSLTVVDDDGQTDSTTKVVEIIELEGTGPPIAVIEGPEVAIVGEEVTFSAANSRPGGDVILAYQWRSGHDDDTGRTQENTFTTIYDEPGIYYAEVTVIDANDLNDSAIMEIMVEITLADASWEMNNPIRGTTVTLEFAETTLSGWTGCNDYSANYSTTPWEDNATNISVGLISSTGQTCSQEVMGQEHGYLSSLQTASRITIDGVTLTMETGSGTLTFKQAAVND